MEAKWNLIWRSDTKISSREFESRELAILWRDHRVIKHAMWTAVVKAPETREMNWVTATIAKGRA